MEKILPNALRLANLLESSGEGCTCHAWAAFECGCGASWPEQYCKEAAKELRRLQEEVDELRQAINVDAVTISAERVDETAKREHEPVAWMDKNSGVVGRLHQWENATPLYTAPPKREWVGLTDEEIAECKIDGGLPHAVNWRLSAKVLQAKLKEKNT